ncbi:MAG: hypothetical protein JNM84_13850 [Planctomycetes bacterium]|nr:hypothetical protein [Planctomycetota bacterium]
MHRCALLSSALAVLLVAPGSAGELDRENLALTSGQWVLGQAPAGLAPLFAGGLRPVDVEISSTNPLQFDAALVANSGSYQKDWWWYYDQTAQGVQEKITLHGARAIDIEGYEVAGQRRFAVLLVSNAGAEYKESWVLADTSYAQVVATAANLNARPIDLERYRIAGVTYYAAILIRNAGADQRAWSHYNGVTAAALGQSLLASSSRLYDLERREDGLYDAIAVVQQNEIGWWFYDVDQAFLAEAIANHGARVIDLERRAVLGQWRYDVVLLNNTDPLATQVGGLMRNASDGAIGCYLKEVGGPIGASLRSWHTIEPAGALKLLLHAHGMKLVEQGYEQLGSMFSVATGLQGSCPNGTAPVLRSVQTALQRAMENASMADAAALRERFSPLALGLRAQQLGLASTNWQHEIGCTGAAENLPNQSSLRDLASIHEQVASGWLVAQRDTFRALMLQSLGGYAGGKLTQIIDVEAQQLGLPNYVTSAFKSLVALAYKEGSYSLSNGEQRAFAAWARLPFRSGTQLAPREYVLGTFVQDASANAAATEALRIGASELLRLEVRAALQSWNLYAPGLFLPLGPGCAGTQGTPQLAGAGAPVLGGASQLLLSSAPQSRPFALILGFSKTSYGPLSLPFDLGLVGAPSCALRTSIDVALNGWTDAQGQAGYAFACPVDPLLVGAHLYAQALCLDPLANALGAITSNALDIQVGGYF